jgi:hypothetical protein
LHSRLRHNCLVVIEALSRLLSEPASIDVLVKQDGGSVLGVTSVLVQHSHDGETSIETNEVGESKGSHGHGTAVLENVVNVLLFSNTGLEGDDGLVDVGHEDSVSQEARGVLGDGRDLAHSLHNLQGGGEGLGRGLQAGDDLDTLLDGHGVHEVGRNDSGGTSAGSSSNLGDGDGRGVGGQDGILLGPLVEVSEDVKLELGDLGDCLNDHVHVGHGRLQVGVTSDPASHGLGLVAGQTAFANVLLKQLVHELETLVQGALVGVNEVDLETGLVGSHQSDSQTHLAGANYGERVDLLGQAGGGGEASHRSNSGSGESEHVVW